MDVILLVRFKARGMCNTPKKQDIHRRLAVHCNRFDHIRRYGTVRFEHGKMVYDKNVRTWIFNYQLFLCPLSKIPAGMFYCAWKRPEPGENETPDLPFYGYSVLFTFFTMLTCVQLLEIGRS